MGWMTSVQGLALRSALRLPAGARAAWLGAPPRNDRGTPLDLDLHTMLRLRCLLHSAVVVGTEIEPSSHACLCASSCSSLCR